jgi:predicted MFS family arabinose efflux permease
VARSKLIWLGLFVGSTVGGLVPSLWGADMLSFSSVLLSGVGGVLGIWLGYRLGD